MTQEYSTNLRLIVALVPFSFALAVRTVPAIAANSSSGSEVLQEVVVTASKRGEQSTQDIPGAIQAISGDTLAKIGAAEFVDYATRVPSLTFNDLGPGDKQYVIRGITSTGPATVGVYYDEAVITASNANDGGGRNADIRLFDLDRIEVLKGPQGTLYGASSMSGTIRYITKQPDLARFGGYVNAEASTTANGGSNLGVNGALNLPIITDKLAVRFTGWDVDNSGFIDAVRIPSGPIENANTERTRGARVTLRWQATDKLALSATTTSQSLHAGGSARFTPPGVQSFGDAGAGFPSIPGGDLVNTDLTQSPWDETIDIYGLTAEYAGDLGTLTATTNYFDRDISFVFDSSPILFFFGVPIPGITLEPQARRITASELRYASKLSGPINFVVGAFSQNEHSDFRVEVVKINAFGNPAGPFSRLDSDDALQNPSGNTFFGRIDNDQLKQFAGFGEVTWTINEQWSLLAGLRYFHSSLDSQNETTHPFGGFGNQIPVGVQTNSASGNKTTFKANLSYKYGAQGLLYATVAQGFRVGGTNAADLPFASGIPPSFAPDLLTNYEIGAKNEFLDRRLRLNGAIYQINWKDIQVQALDNTQAFFFTTNGGKARVRGAELEAEALLGSGFEFAIGGSYIDAVITELPQLSSGSNASLGNVGDRLPKVPRIQYNAALSWGTPVGSSAKLDLRADVAHRGSAQSQFNNANGFDQTLHAYTLANFRANLSWNQWTASLFARNLFDERAEIDAIASAQDPLAHITARPRTVGVAVTRTF
ncbi:MAG: TonB-dependent receptor [Steroidobacteraceae bacterium]